MIQIDLPMRSLPAETGVDLLAPYFFLNYWWAREHPGSNFKDYKQTILFIIQTNIRRYLNLFMEYLE